MCGVVNVRGSIVPAVDLKRKFELEDAEFTVDTSIVVLALELNEIIDEANTINQPFEDIMELIQLQDIIRQSIDHVILFLDEMAEIAIESDSWGTNLDSVCMTERISHLCVEALRDVYGNIEKSFKAFKTDLTPQRKILQRVELNISLLVIGLAEDLAHDNSKGPVVSFLFIPGFS